MSNQFYSLRELSSLTDTSMPLLGELVDGGNLVPDIKSSSGYLFASSRLNAIKARIEQLRLRRRPYKNL